MIAPTFSGFNPRCDSGTVSKGATAWWSIQWSLAVLVGVISLFWGLGGEVGEGCGELEGLLLVLVRIRSFST